MLKFLALEKKLNDLHNMMKAKEEKLRGRHKDTHAALQWLRRNRHLFAGNVHEPMMLVVSLSARTLRKLRRALPPSPVKACASVYS